MKNSPKAHFAVAGCRLSGVVSCEVSSSSSVHLEERTPCRTRESASQICEVLTFYITPEARNRTPKPRAPLYTLAFLQFPYFR